MTDFTVTGAGNVLRYMIEGTAITGAGALFIALFVSDPGTDGGVAADSEVDDSGTAYARVALADKFTVLNSARVAESDEDITWATATGSGFGTVSFIGIMNTATINEAAGSCLFSLDITNVTVASGDQAKISSGNLTITLN